MKKIWTILSIAVIMFSCGGGSGKNSSNGHEVPIGTLIGHKAPPIKYSNPYGKQMSLTDVRGKLALIDFWASWCPPCRHENPNLVENYQKFKDKEFTKGNGFTIFSVSLDKNKEKWVEAIKADNLDWEYHVSDLKEWYSVPASDYKVESIPTNFLIDENGIILAKDLRGEQLGDVLQGYLK